MKLAEMIKELSNISGPSGFEDKIAQKAIELLKPYTDETYFDVMGNVVGVKRCGKVNAQKIMLDAHIDEIGFIITGHEDGFLKFTSIGGVDPRMLPASEIKLMTEPEIIGVVRTMPPHVLSKKQQEEAIKIEDMVIDVGLSQEKATELIPIGTAAVFNKEAFELGENLISGKALDDRACFAILVRAAELLDNEELNLDIYYVGSTQEEVGLRGAKTASFAVNPEYAIVVDVCHAKTFDYSGWKAQEIGNGAAISIGPNMNRHFTKKIIDTATANDLKYQICVDPDGDSGTNTTEIQITREGVCTALISLPLKYMHTPVEVISVEDSEQIARIISETIKSM